MIVVAVADVIAAKINLAAIIVAAMEDMADMEEDTAEALEVVEASAVAGFGF